MEDLNKMMMQVRAKLESIQRSVSIINTSADSLILKAKSMESRQSVEAAVRAKMDIENMLATIEGVTKNKNFPDCTTANGSVVNDVDDSKIAVQPADSNSFQEFASQRINILEKDCYMLNIINDGLQAAMIDDADASIELDK